MPTSWPRQKSSVYAGLSSSTSSCFKLVGEKNEEKTPPARYGSERDRGRPVPDSSARQLSGAATRFVELHAYLVLAQLCDVRYVRDDQ